MSASWAFWNYGLSTTIVRDLPNTFDVRASRILGSFLAAVASRALHAYCLVHKGGCTTRSYKIDLGGLLR